MSLGLHSSNEPGELLWWLWSWYTLWFICCKEICDMTDISALCCDRQRSLILISARRLSTSANTTSKLLAISGSRRHVCFNGRISRC